MQITAAVVRSYGAPYALEELELAPPGPGEVLVRIVGSGMCHSDIIIHKGELPLPLPLVLGHEGAGIVEAVGPGVTDIPVGAHVVLSFDSCGVCPSCSSEHPAYCGDFMLRNVAGRGSDGSTRLSDSDGKEVLGRFFGQSSFATHAIATQRNTVVVDSSLPLEELGPLGCGFQTGAGSILNALDVQPGRTVGVFGVGAVGLAAVMAAKSAGASRVIAVDRHDNRLALAEELGATAVKAADDIVDDLLAVTDGSGLDYALDTTGVPRVVTDAIAATRQLGKIGLVGWQTENLPIGPMELMGRTLQGIGAGDADPQVLIPRLISLWQQGCFPFDRLVQKFDLDAIDEAEEASLNGRVVKPVLVPHR